MYDAYTLEFIAEAQTFSSVQPTAMILKKAGLLLVGTNKGSFEQFSFSKHQATLTQ